MSEEKIMHLNMLSSVQGIDVTTGLKNIILLSKSKCFMLEMEDVLFHHDSGVMMPDNPEGRSSTHGGKDNEQLRVSGVRALALVFRQIQTNPSQRILICGHADRSGKADYNFELSEIRAKGVYCLLTGKREEWAELSESRHQIEDIQQIMKYYALMNGWLCDPGKIDNRWGQNT